MASVPRSPGVRRSRNAAKAKRAAYASSRYESWFDFTTEQAYGPFAPGPDAGFNHYDLDFVYRYVKAPRLAVHELFALAQVVMTQAEQQAAA
ncbi:MAG: hypothetical protein M3P93_06440 [Actinomycetota bacterium]|nr:hypothetical protein [Actinomycetota bacterium]